MHISRTYSLQVHVMVLGNGKPTLFFLCPGPDPIVYPVQSLWSKQGMENLFTFLCPDPYPCTDPKVCISQALWPKSRQRKYTLFLASWSRSMHWSKGLLFTNSMTKIKARKMYLVSHVLIHVLALIHRSALHKLYDQNQGKENVPCFSCPGPGPHADPKVCSSQSLRTKSRQGKCTLFLVSWSRSTHWSKGIPCTNSVVRTWRVLRSGITSGTYR